jgi:hypothetical protein
MPNIIDLNTFKASQKEEVTAETLINTALFSDDQRIIQALTALLARTSSIQYSPGGDAGAIERMNPQLVSHEQLLSAASGQKFNFDVDIARETFTLVFDDDYTYVLSLDDQINVLEMSELAQALEMESLKNNLAANYSSIAVALRNMAAQGAFPDVDPSTFLPHPLDTSGLSELMQIGLEVKQYRYTDSGVITHSINPNSVLKEAEYQLSTVSPEPFNQSISIHFRDSMDTVTVKLPDNFSPKAINDLADKLACISSDNHALVRDNDPVIKARIERMRNTPMPEIDLETQAWMNEINNPPADNSIKTHHKDNISSLNFKRK